MSYVLVFAVSVGVGAYVESKFKLVNKVVELYRKIRPVQDKP